MKHWYINNSDTSIVINYIQQCTSWYIHCSISAAIQLQCIVLSWTRGIMYYKKKCGSSQHKFNHCMICSSQVCSHTKFTLQKVQLHLYLTALHYCGLAFSAIQVCSCLCMKDSNLPVTVADPSMITWLFYHFVSKLLQERDTFCYQINGDRNILTFARVGQLKTFSEVISFQTNRCDTKVGNSQLMRIVIAIDSFLSFNSSHNRSTDNLSQKSLFAILARLYFLAFLLTIFCYHATFMSEIQFIRIQLCGHEPVLFRKQGLEKSTRYIL